MLVDSAWPQTEAYSGIQAVNNDNYDIEHKENVNKILLILWSVYYLEGCFNFLYQIYVTYQEIIMHNVEGGVLFCSLINCSFML